MALVNRHSMERIFVIELYNFNGQSISETQKALREFAFEGNTDKLIFDLRGNPGGLLAAAVEIANFFLDEGEVVAREYFGEGKEEQIWRANGPSAFTDQLKMVILVDRGSASASEIVAGALSEHRKATLVGEKSFGKGSVQELIDITDNTSLKVTVARWLTPNGVSISKNGLAPDFEVETTIEDIKAGKDPQLEKALEVLNTI